MSASQTEAPDAISDSESDEMPPGVEGTGTKRPNGPDIDDATAKHDDMNAVLSEKGRSEPDTETADPNLEPGKCDW